MRSYNKGALRNSLNLALCAVGNAVKEIEHTEYLCLVKCLKVQYYRAACKKIVGNAANLGIGLRTDNLKLNALGLA